MDRGRLQAPNIKLISPGLHGLVIRISLLSVILGALLFLFPYHTDIFFSWTILPPLTAAFLGGTYLSLIVVAQSFERETMWSAVRVVLPGMLLSTTFTLVATLLHLDRFHFTHAGLLSRIMTWGWLIFYSVAPFALLILLIIQLHSPGQDLPPQYPLPVSYRVLLFIEGLIMLLIGIGLFFIPQTFIPFWPWKLTVLAAQSVGAWLIGVGFALGHSAYENAWERTRMVLSGNLWIGILLLISEARFASALQWDVPITWTYTLFCVGMVVLGALGWIEMWNKTTAIG